MIFISWRLSSCWDFSLNVDSNCERKKEKAGSLKLPTQHTAQRSCTWSAMPKFSGLLGFACNALLTLWSLWIFYLFFKTHFLHLLSTYYVLRLGDGEIRREWNKNSDKWTWRKKHLILPEKLRRASLKRWHLILKRWKILQGKEKGEGGERLQREGMDDMSENQVQELWWLFAELLSAEAEAGEAGGRLRKRTWSWR